jgi:hypothetical protein
VVSFTPSLTLKVVTLRPAHSASAASSVKSSPPRRRALRIEEDGKAERLRVCTMRSCARSIVPVTQRSHRRFELSATAITGTAAPLVPAAAHRPRSGRRRKRAGGIVHQHQVRAMTL